MHYSVRLAAPNEASTIDHTGDIISFSDIGPGPVTSTNLPRPWYCYTSNRGGVVWQGPNGGSVTLDTSSGVVAAGSALIFTGAPNPDNDAIALLRGPDRFSPDGEHCCVRIAVGDPESRCVTFSEC